MSIQCPFCLVDFTEDVLRKGFFDVCEPFECDCGAWWYEGMEDVKE
jgi:hypothetical protein